MTFGHVPPPIGHLWPYVVRLLDEAVTRGGNRWEDVSTDLRSGRAQLWLGTDEGKPIFAGVSRIDGDTLEIWLTGGAVIPDGLPHLETVIEASKEAGTTNGRIIGRKGWNRVLRPYGWQARGEDLVKDWAQ